MTVCTVLGGVTLCAALYLLGWERGRRGATVLRMAARWTGTRRRAAEDAARGQAVPPGILSPAEQQAWRELQNFLQYDGSPQSPDGDNET